MGSLCELEYAILLCKDLRYVSSKNYLAFDSEIQSLKRMLYRLHGRLRKSSP